MRTLEANELKMVSGGMDSAGIVVTANIYGSIIPSSYWDGPSGSAGSGYRGPVFYGPVAGGGGGSVKRDPISATNPAGVSGLGGDIDAVIAQSSIMGNELKDVLSWGYHMQWAPTTGDFANRTATDYTNHVIYVASGMSTQNSLGALAHEFGHAMYGHYYGVANSGLVSRDTFVNDWMQNEGYAQVNVIRIASEMAMRDYIHVAGSSQAQVQSEYQAYSGGQRLLASDPSIAMRIGDVLRYEGSLVGNSMRVENAGGGETYEHMYGRQWDEWYAQHPH